MEGIQCNDIEGAMYAFPSLEFPKKYQESNQDSNYPLDTLYCLEILEKTGICLVPGSGFG